MCCSDHEVSAGRGNPPWPPFIEGGTIGRLTKAVGWASSTAKGFTLVELMVAILILSVGLLGLFQAVYSTVNRNLQNQLRAEAVSYGDELMAHELDQPFANISARQTQTWSRAASQGRSLNNGVTFYSFSSVRSHVYVSPNSTDVQIRVSWRYKGDQYSQNLASVVSK